MATARVTVLVGNLVRAGARKPASPTGDGREMRSSAGAPRTPGPKQARRKPAVTRRAMLGLAAAATAGPAAADWDLSHRTTSRHASVQVM